MARNIFVRVFCIFLFLFISIQFFAQIPGEGWVRIGICYSGNITALAVSPNYDEDKTLFVGTIEGGIWISNDRGESWRVCEGFPCNEVATSIALPKNYEYNMGKEIFVVTQSGHFFSSTNEFQTVRYYYDFDPSQSGISCTSIVAGGITGFNGTLYVGTLGAGVFRNTTGGEGGWENITYGQEGLLDCSSLELTSES
ncbi:MAG: hypothetical protein GYA35_07480, partial [Thermoanaerobaculaceae bacterium]|nr:hypothetical protein [Thermoanaerobaculaceae bacterium]